jgi:hypothetical protein
LKYFSSENYSPCFTRINPTNKRYSFFLTPDQSKNYKVTIKRIKMRVVIMSGMKDDFGFEANTQFVPRGPTVPAFAFQSKPTSTVLKSEKVIRTKIVDSQFVNLNYAVKNLRHNQNLGSKYAIAYIILKGKEPKFRCSGHHVQPIIEAVRKWNDMLEPCYDAIIWVDAEHGRYTNQRRTVASRPLIVSVPTCRFLARQGLDESSASIIKPNLARKYDLRPVPTSREIIKENGHPAYGSIYARIEQGPGPNHYDVNQIRYNEHVQRKAPSYTMSGWPKEKKLALPGEEEEEMADSNIIDSEDEDEYEDYEMINDSSLGEQVVSCPLQKRGLTSPRPVFGGAPRFPEDVHKSRSKRQVLQVRRNEVHFIQCTDESPGPQYLPVPSLWGLRGNVGAMSKPEKMKHGTSFGKSPRF